MTDSRSLRSLWRFARAALLLLVGGGCLLVNDNQVVITYEVAQQEFSQDFGKPAQGNVPTVDCSANPNVCSQVTPPQGMSTVCDATSHQCAIQGDVRLVQMVNLSTQKDFPAQVASSSVIQSVQVNNVFYWTPTNTLTFATPPIDLYVGGQTVQTESDPNAHRLGTLPSLPAATLTNCRNNGGTPGTQGTDCTMPLTEDGKTALGLLAKDYKTPFNVLVVAHLVFHAGEPMPGGQLDMFVQPELGFVIPLK